MRFNVSQSRNGRRRQLVSSESLLRLSGGRKQTVHFLFITDKSGYPPDSGTSLDRYWPISILSPKINSKKRTKLIIQDRRLGHPLTRT